MKIYLDKKVPSEQGTPLSSLQLGYMSKRGLLKRDLSLLFFCVNFPAQMFCFLKLFPQSELGYLYKRGELNSGQLSESETSVASLLRRNLLTPTQLLVGEGE